MQILTNQEVIRLAVIQGLTEFLPISSSGHLAIARTIFNTSALPLTLDIILHLGTLLSVLIVLNKEIFQILKACWSRKARISLLDLIIATAITAVVGFAIHKSVADTFQSPMAIGLLLIINGTLLLSTNQKMLHLLKKRLSFIQSGFARPLLVGLAQSLGLLPGISRSGTTITAALISNYKAKEAFQFSFLLYIPAVLGAIILKGFDLPGDAVNANLPPIALGLAISTIVGVVSLLALKKIISKGRLWYFSPYCIILGILLLLL